LTVLLFGAASLIAVNFPLRIAGHRLMEICPHRESQNNDHNNAETGRFAHLSNCVI